MSFEAGTGFPSERALAEQMEVSRPTLREAIGVLSDAGVLRVRLGAERGTFVVSNVIPAGLVRLTEGRVNEMSGVLEARRLFEPQVARLAARSDRTRIFARWGRSSSEQESALDDWPRITQLDTRFHLEIARATGNALVVSMMTLLSRQLATPGPPGWMRVFLWRRQLPPTGPCSRRFAAGMSRLCSGRWTTI